jgi:hypothetical protein
MNLPLSRFKIFVLFLVAATVVFSCTKIITTDIGSGLIPPIDNVNTKDTVLEVVSKNAGYDTVSVGISDDHVLGYVNDPVFGKTTASVNFQIAPTVSPFYLGLPKDSIVLDSVVLCLKYHGTWGDTTQPLKLHVYSMDPEEIFNANLAYSNTKAFEKAQEITDGGVSVLPSTLNDVDSTVFNKEETTNQIRIRLNNSFGQQLINYDSATVYQSDSTFYNSVRGLIVEPDQLSTSNALLEINLLDTATHLSLYYHKLGGDSTTYTRRFSPNSLTSASSNTILRNYSGTQIPSYISSANTNDDLIFMQTSPGTYANLNISSVKGMQNVVVHRAEILMYQVPDLSSPDTFFTPPNLFVAAHMPDSTRRFAVPQDITFYGNTISNLVQFGVAPKPQTDPNTGRTTSFYSFDISRYVQSVITRSDTLFNLVLYAPYNQYIYPNDSTIYALPISSPSLNNVAIGRIRLGGGSNQQYKMRLHIVYSLVQ